MSRVQWVGGLMAGLLVQVGARVTVAAEDAKLMRGGDVVGTLEKGLSFEVTRMIDGWPPRRTYDRVAPPAVRLRPGSLQRLGQPLDRGRQLRDHPGLAFPLALSCRHQPDFQRTRINGPPQCGQILRLLI
jgi:hypothetical protein